METRGSSWHKWDMHLHTPASFHWGPDGNGVNFKDMSDSEKTASIEDFIKTVNTSDVEVFAIQDYWTFDWVFALRDYLKTRDGLKKLVLPGMELRVECPVDYRLNVHVILSDKLTNQQLLDFRSELKIRFSGDIQKNLSNEAIMDFARTLDASKAKVYGFDDPTGLSSDDLLKLGSMTVEITKDSLLKAIHHLPSNSGFIMLPYDTSDGLLKLDWSKHPLDDNYFMQTAHIFESRDQRNIDLFNGRKTDANQDFFDNFVKTLGGSPKPCVAGSDAHTFSDYGKYPSNKATWIKGSLSFRGLEQIRFEPTERVRIQELKPEEKSPQDLVDKVEFIGKDGELQVVLLNQNLNSIIGSRAQGKSNLLKNIAYAVDPKQASIRGVATNDFLPLASFRVFWADGSENTLDPNEEKTKGILFIPQKYLGELIYDKNPKFDTFLTDLFENKDIFQSDLAIYRKFEDQNTLTSTSTLQELLEARRLGIEKADRARKLGNKKSFDDEIKALEDRIKKMGADSSISEADLKKYENLQAEEKTKTEQLGLIQGDVDSFNELKDEDVINADRLADYAFTAATYTKIQKELGETDLQFKKEFVQKEVEELSVQKASVAKEIAELSKKIAPLKDTIKKNAALLELTKSLEKKKLVKRQITGLEDEIAAQKEIYLSKKRLLIDGYLNFEKEYNKLKINLGDLNFSNVKLIISFDEDSLRRLVDDSINYHNSTEFRKDEGSYYANANNFLDDPVSWHYSDADSFKLLMTEIIDGILNGKLLLKSGHDRQIVLASLLTNRYKIDFLKSVSSKSGVAFPDMSDGEQMLALLEFIFKFDDFNYPVLLDQPEDDLDAKAISSTVVDFIKEEKAVRQILIASHNANLVVCGDSENVVISQKHNDGTPFFSYATGAIEDPNVNKEIVEILEGGNKAFEIRRNKLGIK